MAPLTQDRIFASMSATDSTASTLGGSAGGAIAADVVVAVTRVSQARRTAAKPVGVGAAAPLPGGLAVADGRVAAVLGVLTN